MVSQKEWLKYRAKFLKGKRNHEGYYVCELKGEWVKNIEVDHIEKRSVAPHRVLDHTNLRLLCHDCHIEVNPDYK